MYLETLSTETGTAKTTVVRFSVRFRVIVLPVFVSKNHGGRFLLALFIYYIDTYFQFDARSSMKRILKLVLFLPSSEA